MSSQLHKFGYVRIAAVSPELKVADVDFNIEQIVSIIKSATEKKCHFILFPELCITGYSCADLFFQDILITQAKSSVDAIVSATAEYEATVIIGIPILSDSRLYNVAVVISCGDIKGIVPKTFLCNSNEYYEERWFSSEFERISDSIEWNGEQIPFGADLLFHHIGNPDFTFGVELCEDLWSVIPPSSEMALAGATVLLNLSASYEALGKFFYRKQLVQSQSASCIAAYVYSSAGAGESSTDLVFPGHCMVAENGVMLAESERFSFESQIIFADVDIQKLTNDRIKNNTFSKSIPARRFRRIGFCLPDLKDSTINRNLQRMPFVPEDESKRSEVCREIFSIQTTGLAKRIKHLNNCDLVIGVSGGLDSTLALLVAVKAFCKLGLDIKGIHALSMPGLGSSDRTQNNAVQLANLLGVDLRIISIKDAVLNHFSDIGHSAEKKD
ncbi:MAG: NAD(+) synthase, partial [Bacteroidota bacterium]